MWTLALLVTMMLPQCILAGGGVQSTTNFDGYTELEARKAKIWNVFGNSSSVANQKTCALRCSQDVGCTTFYYDAASKRCEHGALLVEFEMPLETTAQPTLPGISLTTGIGEPSMVANTVEDYFSDTNAFCTGLAGAWRMVAPKTMAEVELIQQMYTYYQFPDALWLGLADIDDDGIFAWVEDDTPIDPDFAAQLFTPGYFSIGGPWHCIIMYKDWDGTFLIYNANCNIRFVGLCERL